MGDRRYIPLHVRRAHPPIRPGAYVPGPIERGERRNRRIAFAAFAFAMGLSSITCNGKKDDPAAAIPSATTGKEDAPGKKHYQTKFEYDLDVKDVKCPGVSDGIVSNGHTTRMILRQDGQTEGRGYAFSYGSRVLEVGCSDTKEHLASARITEFQRFPFTDQRFFIVIPRPSDDKEITIELEHLNTEKMYVVEISIAPLK